MAEEKHYSIETLMEECDNRNFLYIRTFKQNSAVFLPLSIFILVGAIVLVLSLRWFSLFGILKCFGISFIIVTTVILTKLELRHRERIKKDKSGAIGSRTKMEFFNNYMTMETSFVEGVNKLSYKTFYGMIETKNYYILYYSRAQATLLRKKDISPEIKEDFGEFIRDKFEGKYRKL